MKCIKSRMEKFVGAGVVRVSNEIAAQEVAAGRATYISKAEWKAKTRAPKVERSSLDVLL